MALSAPDEKINELIDALGLANKQVTELHMSISMNDLVTFKVTMYADSEHIEEITEIVKDYVLMEKDEHEEKYHPQLGELRRLVETIQDSGQISDRRLKKRIERVVKKVAR